jgi:hypothetical protein
VLPSLVGVRREEPRQVRCLFIASLHEEASAGSAPSCLQQANPVTTESLMYGRRRRGAKFCLPPVLLGRRVGPSQSTQSYVAPSRLGRCRGGDGLQRHQQHHAHRIMGTARTPLAQQRYALPTARTGGPPPSVAPSARAYAHTQPPRTRIALHARQASRESQRTRRRSDSRNHRTAACARAPHCAPHAPRSLAQHRRQ